MLAPSAKRLVLLPLLLAACAQQPVRPEARVAVPYGERPTAEISKVVTEAGARLAGCFALGGNRPSWLMAVALAPDGNVVDARLDALEDLPSSAQWCGMETLRALRFPAEPGTSRIMLAALTSASGDPGVSQVLVQRVGTESSDPRTVLDGDLTLLRSCRGSGRTRSLQPGFSRGVRDPGGQVAIDNSAPCLDRLFRAMAGGR